MTRIRIASRESTILWSGDTLILGATLHALETALELTEQGKAVCLVDPSPSLGTEISRCWMQEIPDGPLALRVRKLCREMGAPDKPPIDIVTATLAFDQVVEGAGIRALVALRPTRALTNPDGSILGVEVVGKSGRQLIKAATILDCTPGGRFSRRMTGTSAPTARNAERRFYLYGLQPGEENAFAVPPELGIAGDEVRLLPAAWPGEVLLSITVPADNNATDSWLLEETLLRGTRAFEHLRDSVPSFAQAALMDVAPDCRIEYDQPADVIALEGPACAEAHGAALGGDLLVTAELTATTEWDLEATVLPEAAAVLHEPVDVVVAGWGTGGSFAAFTAAADGATVAALDPVSLPGGIGTAGQIHGYYYGRQGGFQDMLEETTSGRSAVLAPKVRGFHPVGKAEMLLVQMRGRNVLRFPGHTVFGVIKSNDTVEGVVSAAPDGYHVFPCKVVIDGTGDGDVAVAAGADFRLGRQGDGFPQPYSYTPTRVGDDGTLHSHNFDAGWVDPTDTLDFSRAHFEGRSRIRALGPFSEAKHYCTLAAVLGLRESRFIAAPVTLTFPDVMEGKHYPDTVCDAYANYDNHAMNYAEESEWARRHVVMFGLWALVCSGELPYRALLPDGIDGMLIACRALSVDHDLHQLLRMQRDLQKIGEICGTAAAIAAKQVCSPAQLGFAELRKRLKAKGVEPVAMAVSLAGGTIDEEFDRLGSEDNGLAMWRLSQMNPDSAKWDQFFAEEKDDQRRFCAAVAAAIAGKTSDDVRDALITVVDQHVKEPTLGRKSPPPYIVALLALNEMGDPSICKRIRDVLQRNELIPAHVVLLLKALGDSGSPEGIAVLKEFLPLKRSYEGIMWGCPDDLSTSFDFVVELRVIRSLHALGCHDEDALLNKYVDDSRLLVRRYARRLRAGNV
jgi:hypothetical protein